MHENRNKYCCHCLTKIQDPGGDFCSECGKRHSVYYGQSYELPAGTYLSGGRYFVGKCIGSGGFGITYVGYDTKLEKKILIKETFYNGIFKRNTHDPDNPEPLKVTYGNEFSLDDIMRKTKKECISLSEGEGLNNIVKVYDWFSENNTAYIITEFINGVTLYERVCEKGRYSWEEYYSKLKPLMIGLSSLHKKGIIHRDIKPQNIMIRNIEGLGEEFVLIDFGLARSNETKTMASMGISFSPGYSPFEQRSFSTRDGEYTDVYSLAATSYFAVTGENPTIDMENTVDGNFPKIKYLKGQYGVPENVVQGLRKALAINYEERCQTIDQLIKSFEKKGKNTTTTFEDKKLTVPNTVIPTINSVQSSTENDKPNINEVDMNTQAEYDKIIREAKESIDLPKEKKTGKKFIIPAALAVVLVVGVVIAVFVLPNNNGSSEDSGNASNSSQAKVYTLSEFEEDAANLNTFLKEAVTAYDNYDTTKTWNGRKVDKANVHDICVENNIDDSGNYYSRNIDNKQYSIVYTQDNELVVCNIDNVKIFQGYYSDCTIICDYEYGDYGVIVSSDTYITDITILEFEDSLDYDIFRYDIDIMNLLLKEAVKEYQANNTTRTWNGKTAAKATVHDVCVENNIDDFGEYYEREIYGETLHMKWYYDTVGMPDGLYMDWGAGGGINIDGDFFINDIPYDETSETNSFDDYITMDSEGIPIIDHAYTLNIEVKAAIKKYNENDTTTKWNGKTAAEATVHDICVEKGLDDSQSDFYETEDEFMAWSESGSIIVMKSDYKDTATNITGDIKIKDLKTDE